MLLRATSQLSSRHVPLRSAQLNSRKAHCRQSFRCKTSEQVRRIQRPAAQQESAEVEGEVKQKSEEYTDVMNQRMGSSLVYRHEDGINWSVLVDDVIVGSCLQTPDDVDKLRAAGITTVFCLQEDCDLEYFGIDWRAIQDRCAEAGDIKHVRFPIRDFDPHSLRQNLPKAIVRLAKEHDPKAGRVYIHCTAGMGRAPGVALAYLFWLRGWDLDEAYTRLRSVRSCSPKLSAIRAATADLLLGVGAIPVTLALYREGSAQRVQLAGLDVGWGNQLDLEWSRKLFRWELTRQLLPGRYSYKFIIDGHWTYSPDHPHVLDGGNINNWVDVMPAAMNASILEKQSRLLTDGGKLHEQERAELSALLSPFR